VSDQQASAASGGRTHRTPHLSVVSRVYGCADPVAALVAQVSAQLEAITPDYEIVLVDDGSPDEGWRAIEELCRHDPRVKGVALSRNFGQNKALVAGLATARGDHVIVLDCDLQDHPRYIPDLYRLAAEGWDIVYTRKVRRRHRGLRNFFGRVFHAMLNVLLSDPRSRTEANIGNYSILSRRAVDAFLGMRDYQFHYLGRLRWIGFDHTYLDIEHFERPSGRSAYTFRRLMKEAMVGITSQSERLLHLSVLGGFVFVGLAIVLAVVLVVMFFFTGFLEGWTSLMVALLLATGVILTSLGITGIYIGNVFEQVKQRPLYIVKETRNVALAAPAAEERPGDADTEETGPARRASAL